ncbi:hypothetical protein [Cetacean poxvirus 1]|nr:hypothetical protein [Cetacean poxvirus 1]
MDVNKLEDLYPLNPLRNMKKIKMSLDRKCIFGNECFLKVDEVYKIPKNAVDVNSCIIVRRVKFTLLDLLYSPFQFHHNKQQIIMPLFIVSCIKEVVKKQQVCKYAVIQNKNNQYDGLSINIFIPTTNKATYIIIGLRFKYFWSSTFKIE